MYAEKDARYHDTFLERDHCSLTQCIAYDCPDLDRSIVYDVLAPNSQSRANQIDPLLARTRPKIQFENLLAFHLALTITLRIYFIAIMLYVVGLGLSDEKDITVKGLEVSICLRSVRKREAEHLGCQRLRSNLS